jgi:hypothetical protein
MPNGRYSLCSVCFSLNIELPVPGYTNRFWFRVAEGPLSQVHYGLAALHEKVSLSFRAIREVELIYDVQSSLMFVGLEVNHLDTSCFQLGSC